MNIEKLTLTEKQAFWNEQLSIFKEHYIMQAQLDVLYFDNESGNFEIKEESAVEFEKEDFLEAYHSVNTGWSMWLRATTLATSKLEGCVVVPKDQTEDWYLDPDEHMWWEADGIDGTLCDLNIGEVAAIEHKEYLITESDTLYAAKVWDSENEDVGFWEFFKTGEEANKAAAHCKAMVEAARGGNESA